MIRYTKGNLLEADAEALVNAVNTVGVMGKGLALQFKQAFPENYNAYLKAYRNEELKPGKILTVPTGRFINPKYIFNFPTKRHWRDKSRIEDIEASIVDLVSLVRELNIKSIAIPPLGCGYGGLNWSEVKPKIEDAFKQLPNVDVLIYEPGYVPGPDGST